MQCMICPCFFLYALLRRRTRTAPTIARAGRARARVSLVLFWGASPSPLWDMQHNRTGRCLNRMNITPNRMYYRQMAKAGFFFLAAGAVLGILDMCYRQMAKVGFFFLVAGVVLGILATAEVRSHGWTGAVVLPFQMKGTGEHPKIDVKAAAFLSSLLFGGGLVTVCLGVSKADAGDF